MGISGKGEDMGEGRDEMSIEIEVDVICDECGNFLDAEVRNTSACPKIRVIPCSECLKKAREEGYDDAR